MISMKKILKKIFKNIKAVFSSLFSCLNILKTKRLFKTLRFNFLFLTIISLTILVPLKIYFYPPDVSLQEARAVGITWDGSESSDWTIGANWIGDTVPISTDDVIIDGAYTHAPILDLTSGTTTINSLSLGATIASTLTLSN